MSLWELFPNGIPAGFNDRAGLGFAAGLLGGGCGAAGCNAGGGGCCGPNPAGPGLATWLVKEPHANLWLTDMPMRYQASRGRNVSFKLFYKNRQGPQGAAENAVAGIFSVGNRWHTFWRAYLEAIPSESTNFWVYFGDGNAVKYTIGQAEYGTMGKLTQISTTNLIEYRDGSLDVFGLTTTFGGVTRHFLTQRQDLYSNTMTFQYIVTNNTIRLDQVRDVDDRSITFEYSAKGDYSNVITKVIGPHGMTNVLQYDSSARLTNITDSVGLRSQMQYDSDNLTALLTPYGTTTFTYFTITNQMDAVKVTELGVRNHLYLYDAQVDGGKVPANYTSYVPSTTNGSTFAIANTFDHLNSDQRNSFHWGPRQYENLSDNVRTNLNNGSFNVSNLTSGDYLRARMNHWLKATGSTNPGVTLSFRRDASPDGSTQGQINWRDFVGKTSPDEQGTVSAPRFRATNTFARTNVSLLNGTNTFTAVALDNWRADTNTTTAYLPSSVSFAYDGNGNLITNGTRLLEYDDENQLIRITEASAWKSEFTYDAKLRRRIRKEYTWQSSSWVLSAEVRYVYDGKLVVQERDGLNTPAVAYTRGRDLSGGLDGAGGIGGLLARTESWRLNSDNPSAAHAYYQADGNGNVTTLSDTNQILVARYLFDPFGNTLAASGPLAEANLYRFSSKEFHVASGLVHYLYRFYDPTLQRWPNRDPIEESGFFQLSGVRERTSPTGNAAFAAFSNDPISRVDPLGLFQYGRYCGWSARGPGAPIDQVDAACQDHDNCLGTLGDLLSPGGWQVCNSQFCAKLLAADCSVSPTPTACNRARLKIYCLFCGLLRFL